MTPVQYKYLRQRIGSQAEVAKLLGLDQTTISKRECGKVKISKEAEIAIREVVKNV